MGKNRRTIGATYEKIAGAYLEMQGYQILEYNYRYRRGEIDIVAQEGEYLVFCEVKYRADKKTGHPAEAVDYRKQKTISQCALYYLTAHGMTDRACRFDVLSIEGEQITLYRNAFDYAGQGVSL